MKSNSYIRYIMRYRITLAAAAATVLLSGCAEPRIARTNCWSAGATNTTVSTKGSSPILEPESDAALCR